MSLQYKIRQLKNILSPTPKGRPIKWAFIYGLPRSGTTYALHQFMKVAKAGIGDWEIKEFAHAITNAENREWVALDTKKLIDSLRENLLENAHVGGGNKIDIVAKQISTNKEEFEFYREMFQSEPQTKLFMFREPDGWLPSAMEKFNITENEAIEVYKNALAGYNNIQGNIIEYNETLPEQMGKLDLLKNCQLDPFEIKRKAEKGAPEELQGAYKGFIKKYC